jgi:hypothetical protein
VDELFSSGRGVSDANARAAGPGLGGALRTDGPTTGGDCRSPLLKSAQAINGREHCIVIACGGPKTSRRAKGAKDVREPSVRPALSPELINYQLSHTPTR